MKGLYYIENKVSEMAEIINAPKNFLPSYGYSKNFIYPAKEVDSHIEVDKEGKFYYVVVERGVIKERITFGNINDLLYKIFKHVTFEMACDYEVNHRIDGQDFRIILFKKQEELMRKLNKKWEKILKEKHEKLLK